MATTVILGAGDLGGTIARQLAALDVFSTVILVDDAESVAQGKALDIRQAAPIDGYFTAVHGMRSIDAVVSAQFIVLADKAAQLVEWQADDAVSLIQRVTALNSSAPILCAGSAQHTVIERAVRDLGMARSRIFGTAPEALRSAIAAIAALEAGCAATDINLSVLGRPPHQIIVPWEGASIGGRQATSVLAPPAIVRLDGRLSRLWPPGPFALASAATHALSTAVSCTARSVTAFVSISGEEGTLGKVGMLPVQLARHGIVSVTTPELTRRDRVRLETALS